MLACIDLGSNSFHLLIAEQRRGRIKIVERLSEKIQLGENIGSSGNISQKAYQRGMACLHRFKLLMRQKIKINKNIPGIIRSFLVGL